MAKTTAAQRGRRNAATLAEFDGAIRALREQAGPAQTPQIAIAAADEATKEAHYGLPPLLKQRTAQGLVNISRELAPLVAGHFCPGEH